MNELYSRVYASLGEAHMLILTTEELSELTKAISKYQRNKIKTSKGLDDRDPTLLEAIADEIADVEIMTEQIKQAYNMQDKVQTYKSAKLDRLEERVKVYENKLRR
jgi:NTP pyrophosphatase (non-canonical NTP hydrolase)